MIKPLKIVILCGSDPHKDNKPSHADRSSFFTATRSPAVTESARGDISQPHTINSDQVGFEYYGGYQVDRTHNEKINAALCTQRTGIDLEPHHSLALRAAQR